MHTGNNDYDVVSRALRKLFIAIATYDNTEILLSGFCFFSKVFWVRHDH